MSPARNAGRRESQRSLFDPPLPSDRERRAAALVHSGGRPPDGWWTPPLPDGGARAYVDTDAYALAAEKAAAVAASSADGLATLGVSFEKGHFGFFVFAGRVGVTMMAEATVWYGDGANRISAAVGEAIQLLHEAGIADRAVLS